MAQYESITSRQHQNSEANDNAGVCDLEMQTMSLLTQSFEDLCDTCMLSFAGSH